MTLSPRLCRTMAAAVLVPASLALAACGDDEPLAKGASLASGDAAGEAAAGPAEDEAPAGRQVGAAAQPDPDVAAVGEATLHDPAGATAGTVRFETLEAGGTRVLVDLEAGGQPGAFHGLHIHANDDPANGDGCVADPAALPDTWFASADGHLAAAPEDVHANHRGDMPSVLVMADGKASSSFMTDRFTVDDVEGAAVVLHAGPDNFAHVPTGPGPDQYTPNSVSASDLTTRTGNASHRIACGTISEE